DEVLEGIGVAAGDGADQEQLGAAVLLDLGRRAHRGVEGRADLAGAERLGRLDDDLAAALEVNARLDATRDEGDDAKEHEGAGEDEPGLPLADEVEVGVFEDAHGSVGCRWGATAEWERSLTRRRRPGGSPPRASRRGSG